MFSMSMGTVVAVARLSGGSECGIFLFY